MSDDQHQLLTLAEAAARLQVSVKTIRRYIATGRLAGYRLGPTMLRVPTEAVDHMLEQLPTAKERAVPRTRQPGRRPSPFSPTVEAYHEWLDEIDHMWPDNIRIPSLDENRKLQRPQ